jgi:hypothetical protein
MRAGILRGLILVAAVALARSAPARAQDDRPARERDRAEALRVFVDCRGVACDEDYLRTKIDVVTYVRDRHDAQVTVLITMEETGSLGAEYTARFIGREEFAGEDDTLRIVLPPAQTQDELRIALADLLKRGLVRYMNHTRLGDRIRVSYAAPAATPASPPQRDPWNHWVFSTTINGSATGEQSTSQVSLNASLSADRTSEDWKINTSIQGGYSKGRIDAGAAGEFTTLQHSYAFDALVVRSVGGHWSLGARTTLTSSTFLNQSLTTRVGPAVEYNVFRYADATRRQLTVQYSVGVTALDYIEETIFGRMSQRLVDERVLATLALKQPWGSISTSLEGSHFLNDLGKRRGIGFTSMDVRLFRGLSLLVFGGFELVRDQLFLPRRDASTEELLLQQREQATSFRYFSSIGISYTFGSRFADVVNSRFAGSSAGTNIIQ